MKTASVSCNVNDLLGPGTCTTEGWRESREEVAAHAWWRRITWYGAILTLVAGTFRLAVRASSHSRSGS